MKGPKNHDDAKASCAGAGGRLVELHSERKQDVVLYMERYLSQRGHSMDEPIIGASAIGIVRDPGINQRSVMWQQLKRRT